MPEVTGYSPGPPSEPNNFDASRSPKSLSTTYGVISATPSAWPRSYDDNAPDVIFHLAAQPIVRTSLLDPRETFEVNVVGTASVLDAVRHSGNPVCVSWWTSDKCYRNDGQVWGFRETDPLGGHDPYSASKAGCRAGGGCLSIILLPRDRIADHGVRLASVRAGNVIGGGTGRKTESSPTPFGLWPRNDLIVRNPDSTRPWQHVLEPLSGYLAAGGQLLATENPGQWTEAWNFGPCAQ